MKRSGRVNLVAIVAVVIVLIVLPLMCVSSAGPERVAYDFMNALGSGNIDELVRTSSIGNADDARKRELWTKTMERSRNYAYTWRIIGVQKDTPTTAAVRIMMRQNIQIRMGTDEVPFQLPLIQENGKWKVDVHALNRKMFPALPRA